MESTSYTSRIVVCISCARMTMISDPSSTKNTSGFWSKSTFHLTVCSMCESIGSSRITTTITVYTDDKDDDPPTDPRPRSKVTTKMTMLTTTSGLTHALTNVPDFRTGLMSELGATDVSLVMSLCKLPMTKKEMMTYLDPVRDLHWMAEMERTVVDMGYTPMLVGLDTFNLINRIKDPIKCWADGNGRRMISLWLYVNDNGLRDMVKQQALEKMYKHIMRMPGTTTDRRIRPTAMTATLSSRYPFRLVMDIPTDVVRPHEMIGSLWVDRHKPYDWNGDVITLHSKPTIFNHTLDQITDWNAFDKPGERVVRTGIINLIANRFVAREIVSSPMANTSIRTFDTPRVSNNMIDLIPEKTASSHSTSFSIGTLRSDEITFSFRSPC